MNWEELTFEDLGLDPNSFMSRPSSVDDIIRTAGQTYGIGEDLIRAVIDNENPAWDPKATSPTGAAGYMQLIRSTAQNLGVRDRYDPYENIMGGAKLLRENLDATGGREDLALAMYHTGRAGLTEDRQAINPYATDGYILTKNHVANILRTKQKYAGVQISAEPVKVPDISFADMGLDPADFGISEAPVEEPTEEPSAMAEPLLPIGRRTAEPPAAPKPAIAETRPQFAIAEPSTTETIAGPIVEGKLDIEAKPEPEEITAYLQGIKQPQDVEELIINRLTELRQQAPEQYQELKRLGDDLRVTKDPFGRDELKKDIAKGVFAAFQKVPGGKAVTTAAAVGRGVVKGIPLAETGFGPQYKESTTGKLLEAERPVSVGVGQLGVAIGSQVLGGLAISGTKKIMALKKAAEAVKNPYLRKLAQMGVQAIPRTVAGTTYSTLQEVPEVIQGQQTMAQALKRIGAVTGGNIVSVTPEILLPKNLLQPFAQAATGLAFNYLYDKGMGIKYDESQKFLGIPKQYWIEAITDGTFGAFDIETGKQIQGAPEPGQRAMLTPSRDMTPEDFDALNRMRETFKARDEAELERIFPERPREIEAKAGQPEPEIKGIEITEATPKLEESPAAPAPERPKITKPETTYPGMGKMGILKKEFVPTYKAYPLQFTDEFKSLPIEQQRQLLQQERKAVREFINQKDIELDKGEIGKADSFYKKLGKEMAKTSTAKQQTAQRERKQFDRYVETGKPDTKLTTIIHEDTQYVLNNVDNDMLYEALDRRYSKDTISKAVDAIRKGEKDGKAAEDIRKEVSGLLYGGRTPDIVVDEIVADVEAKAEIGGKAMEAAGEIKPEDVEFKPEEYRSEAMNQMAQELDADFAAQKAEIAAKGEAGFFGLPGGKKPKEVKGGVEEVRKTLEAGREPGATVVEKITNTFDKQVNALKDNFLEFQSHLKTEPQFKDDYRTEFVPMRGRQIETIMKWRYSVFNALHKAEGKKGIQKAVDLVYLRDLAQRGSEGQQLPNDLSVEQVQKHLSWLEGNSSNEAKVAAVKIRKIFDGLGQELASRGKIGTPRPEYAPHTVLDYRPDWMTGLRFPMKRKFGQPFRPYTKKAIGSKRFIATSDESLWSNIAKVMLDNAQEDWMLKQAAKYDALPKYREQLKATGKKAPALHKGQRVVVDDKPYVAMEWKKTSYRIDAIDDAMLQKALDENMLVQEWLDTKGPKGGEPVREVIAKGRPSIVLLPENIAKTMDNLIERSPAIWDVMYSLGKATQLWKSFTLTTAGLPYQLGNLIGDTINTGLFDPGAFKYLGSANRIATHLFYPDSKLAKAINLTDFEKQVLRVANEKDVARSGMFAELRRYTGFSDIANKYEQASQFRESINRLSILAHQLDRVRQGKPVQNVAGIKLEGLDPESAAGKVSREALVDYSATPRLYQLLLTRGVAPFVRFHEANLRNHVRAATGTQQSALRYWAPVVTTYAAAWAYNNLDEDRKALEMQLPDYMRNRLHVVLGKDKEGNVMVWGMQQPVDMALSWFGMDSLGRILSDLHGGKLTYKKAARELLSEVGNGWRQNANSLLNPWAQFLQGLITNHDPFTRRKVMPDAIHDAFNKDMTYPEAYKYIMPYLAEKTITPIVQFTRTKRGDEPTTHPVLDWLKEGPFNVKRAVGFYIFDPTKQVLSEHYDAKQQAQATYEYWRQRAYDIVLENGYDQKRLVELAKDANEAGVADVGVQIDKWLRTPKVQIAAVNHKLRQTTDDAERRKLLAARKVLQANIAKESLESIPVNVRRKYLETISPQK